MGFLLPQEKYPDEHDDEETNGYEVLDDLTLSALAVKEGGTASAHDAHPIRGLSGHDLAAPV